MSNTSWPESSVAESWFLRCLYVILQVWYHWKLTNKFDKICKITEQNAKLMQIRWDYVFDRLIKNDQAEQTKLHSFFPISKTNQQNSCTFITSGYATSSHQLEVKILDKDKNQHRQVYVVVCHQKKYHIFEI